MEFALGAAILPASGDNRTSTSATATDLLSIEPRRTAALHQSNHIMNLKIMGNTWLSFMVGAEGFEPPSTGLEPVIIPGYTIPPICDCTSGYTLMMLSVG